jgi:hypothetical protein
VVDVGHSIELYSEFSCTGGTYTPFPTAGQHRIFLADLARADIRERLHLVWTDPLSLDPTRRSAKATREIAAKLASLAMSLERGGHEPHMVASFLMRCLFTMFAEDVWLIGKGSFTRLLESLTDTPDHFVPMVEELWRNMNTGGFSTTLRLPVLQFNGGLFEDSTALPLTRDQLLLLIEAARCEWRDVEPAIFGTLLERALDPVERHKLGAHYTPRAYVERLVLRTVMEPLREQWQGVQAAAVKLANDGDTAGAAAEIRRLHDRLCKLRILDPACGTGNFLYVTFDHLKRLEGELFDMLGDLGQGQLPLELPGETVFPNQFLGIEVNPRAAAIAELVLWIGALQWHYRTRGRLNQPPQPIIRNFHNIECRDAVLAWDAAEPVIDDDGNPVTHWDGRTTKPHPTTGREVPDESAQIPVMRYANPRPAAWPQADYVVGNPPFIGTARMRDALGDGYTEALRKAHREVGNSSDFVMYWWNHAADLVRAGKLRRFGLVTTNSLSQTFNRRVIERHLDAKPPLSLAFAVPDHPWVDSTDGAAVRIAMTVGVPGDATPGVLATVTYEQAGDGEGYDVTISEQRGTIHADLTVGADVSGTVPLQANEDLSNRGFCLFGSGFIVTPDEAERLGLGRVPGLEQHIRPYRNGRDLTATPRGVMVIDLYGLTADQVRQRFPEVYQWVYERVKPERENNKRKCRRENWWIFGEPNPKLRRQLDGLPRYIATVETSKHRFFQFLDIAIMPDNMLVNVASEDAFVLGMLSSRAHVAWALAAGGRLGYGNDPRYNKTRCFETFAFPDANESQKAHIRELGEQLDAHRKARQAMHSKLTITDMYNVLERERAGEPLTAKEKTIHEQALVAVLRDIHDELDRAVLDAYGWPHDIGDDELLQRLVALNAARAAEEQAGLVRWLRPDYQCPDGAKDTHGGLGLTIEPETAAGKAARTRHTWPSRLSDRMQALREVLTAAEEPLSAVELARRFKGARSDTVAELLETLADLGHVRRVDGERFGASQGGIVWP